MQTKQDRRRIKELERELLRTDRALAETAALLVLSKKLAWSSPATSSPPTLAERACARLARPRASTSAPCSVGGPRRGLVAGDGRPQTVRRARAHALTPAERAEVMRVANGPCFAAVPPARIVSAFANEGV